MPRGREEGRDVSLALLAVAPAAGVHAQPVPSLTPAATHRLWLAEIRAAARRRAAAQRAAAARRLRLPARAGDPLRPDRLAAPRDEARPGTVPVCRVLRLDPAARRRQDPAARQPGRVRSARSGRSSTPLDEISWTGWNALGELAGRDVVRRRRRGPATDGCGRVRREAGRHLGAERAFLGGAQRDRDGPADALRASCAASRATASRASSSWPASVSRRPTSRRTS